MIDLIPRFPGAKNPRKYKFDDGTRFDALIAPFAGSGRFELDMLWKKRVKTLIVADADKGVYSVWMTWLCEQYHQDFYKYLDGYKSWFTNDLPLLQFMGDRWDSETPKTFEDRWSELKSVYDDRAEDNIPKIAAAYLVTKKLACAGGVMRQSPRSGKLNISADRGGDGKIHKSQIAKLPNWNYQLPPNFGASVYIYQDWADAVGLFESMCDSFRNAVAHIDPPYWLPLPEKADAETEEIYKKRKYKNLMTPAYPGHEPHADFTLQLCLEPTKRLLGNPVVERAIVANYWSEELHRYLQGFAGLKEPFSYQFRGKLQGTNMKESRKVESNEGIWWYGKPLDFKQMQLWDVA